MKKKDKDQNKSEQPPLSDEQLEMLSTHLEEDGDDRSNIEPFDQSTKAKIIRYAKSHKILAISFVIIAVSIIAVISLLLVYLFSLGFTNWFIAIISWRIKLEKKYAFMLVL